MVALFTGFVFLVVAIIAGVFILLPSLMKNPDVDPKVFEQFDPGFIKLAKKIPSAKKMFFILLAVTVVWFFLFPRFFNYPPDPLSLNITSPVVETPHFIITLPENIKSGRANFQMRGAQYFFTSSSSEEGASEKIIVDVEASNNAEANQLANIARGAVKNKAEQEKLFSQLNFQKPKPLYSKGIFYSSIVGTVPDTNVVVLKTAKFGKLYGLGVVVQNADPVARAEMMNALLTSVNSIQFIRTPFEEETPEFIKIMILFISAVLLYVTLITGVIAKDEYLETRYSSSSELEIIKQEVQQVFDVEDDPVLSKYRIELTSEVGKKKFNTIKSVTTFYIVILMIFGAGLKLYTEGKLAGVGELILTIPGIQFIYPFTIWHGALLGLLCLIPSLMVRNIYIISGLLLVGASIELSCVIVGVLWPEIAFFGVSQGWMILLLTMGTMKALAKVLPWFLSQYLMKQYVGKTFQLKENIRLKNLPGLLVQPGHIGIVTLKGLKIIVIGDDLSFPIGATIKVIGINRKLRGLIVERG